MSEKNQSYSQTARFFTVLLGVLIFTVLSCGKSDKKKEKSQKNSSAIRKKLDKEKQKVSKKNVSNKFHNPVREKKNKRSSSSLVLTDLFQYNNKGKIPSQIKKTITLQEFADIIKKETPQISKNEFLLISETILKDKELDSGELGLYLYSLGHSDRISELGYHLITQSCITKIEFFRPEKFFIAFAQLGFSAEPFLNDIIFNTKSDFIRAWASELYVEIFYHNAEKTDGRYQKLADAKDAESAIMEKLGELFSKPEKVRNILKSESIGMQIRKAIGEENRYSLKMLQVLKMIDNLNSKNLFAVSKRLPEIIKNDSYDYSLFDYLDRKIEKKPLISPKAQLKYFTDAVFTDNISDTYRWIPEENGGFSLNDLSDAFKNNNTDKMFHMIKVFKEIICTVLKGKLLLGQGNRELKLLQYFYHSHWLKKNIEWNDSMIVIENNTGTTVHLVLQKRMKPIDILTGADILKKEQENEDRRENFLIPAFSSFIWFAPDGKFTLGSQEQLPDINNVVKFQDREFVLSSSMHISIY